MNRRTFLKVVFAASVAPASVIKVLYETRPVALTTEQIMNMALSRLRERPHRNVIFCSTPSGRNHLYDLFKFGDVKTKRISRDIEGNVWKDGVMIHPTDWPQPPK